MDINKKIWSIIREYKRVKIRYRGSLMSVWDSDLESFGDLLTKADNERYLSELLTIKGKMESVSDKDIEKDDRNIKLLVYNNLLQEIDKLIIDMDVSDILKYLMICLFRFNYSKNLILVEKLNRIIEYHLWYILGHKKNDIYKKDKLILGKMIEIFNEKKAYNLVDLANECMNMPVQSHIKKQHQTKKNSLNFNLEKKLRESMETLELMSKKVTIKKNTEVQKYFLGKLRVDNIELEIIKVDGIFERFISDVGICSKHFLATDSFVLFVNRDIYLNKQLSEAQLNLLYIHEINPGHLKHVQNAMVHQYQELLGVCISKECLEGWALYSEYTYSLNKRQEKFLFEMHLSRRLSALFYRYHGMRATVKLLSEYDISNDIKQYIMRSIDSKVNYVSYLNGFFKLQKLGRDYPRILDNVFRYGPLDLDFLSSLEEGQHEKVFMD